MKNVGCIIGGREVGILGQGTWRIGENLKNREQEIASIRRGIQLGLTTIDTAEIYGDGASEELIGEAIKPFDCNKLNIISKVYPFNAGRKRIFNSCDESLKRLGVDNLDLYLLHWRGNIPLEETVECMEELIKRGKIKSWGVSNFDVDDMEELYTVRNGNKCAANQVLYHLGSRGIEYDLIPWMKERNIPLIAYCPLAQQGRLERGLLSNPVIKKISDNHNITPMQVLLSFVLSQENLIAIPKASSIRHVEENAAVINIKLTEEELKELNIEFPSPNRKTSLDIV